MRGGVLCWGNQEPLSTNYRCHPTEDGPNHNPSTDRRRKCIISRCTCFGNHWTHHIQCKHVPNDIRDDQVQYFANLAWNASSSTARLDRPGGRSKRICPVDGRGFITSYIGSHLACAHSMDKISQSTRPILLPAASSWGSKWKSSTRPMYHRHLQDQRHRHLHHHRHLHQQHHLHKHLHHHKHTHLHHRWTVHTVFMFSWGLTSFSPQLNDPLMFSSQNIQDMLENIYKSKGSIVHPLTWQWTSQSVHYLWVA